MTRGNIYFRNSAATPWYNRQFNLKCSQTQNTGYHLYVLMFVNAREIAPTTECNDKLRCKYYYFCICSSTHGRCYRAAIELPWFPGEIMILFWIVLLTQFLFYETCACTIYGDFHSVLLLNCLGWFETHARTDTLAHIHSHTLACLQARRLRCRSEKL